ncbi:MAG: hypothetical protein JST47_08545 [Bacteroidetes bacterium]|nr:hypothetical protein [Bacteroidota bacterium]MBS1973333.1 hypothetical protein [Bacteroidota bacterium]
MKRFICILFAIALLGHTSFASQNNLEKSDLRKTHNDSLTNSVDGKAPQKSSAKICACQVLGVTSNNSRSEQLIAVFAEGSNTGNLSFNFATASSVLQKEKKHLQYFFFNKIKVYEKVTSAFSCRSLYNSLRSKYDNLELYDVLNADALGKIDNSSVASR